MSASEIGKLMEADNADNRAKFRQLFRAPVFAPINEIPLARDRALALQRLQQICAAGLISVFDFERNPLNIFAAHEMAGFVDGSMATKMTVQFNLFGGTLIKLGGERHRALLRGVDTLDAIGCFGLTELGYGNNAVEMETTATYEHGTRSLRIRTPSTLAQKYWITNGAGKESTVRVASG